MYVYMRTVGGGMSRYTRTHTTASTTQTDRYVCIHTCTHTFTYVRRYVRMHAHTHTIYSFSGLQKGLAGLNAIIQCMQVYTQAAHRSDAHLES